jgi:hypothetical protein
MLCYSCIDSLFTYKLCSRFHAGVEPVSTIGFPIIPDSAFDAAMQEYIDDPDTDTDGENGDSD